MKRIVWLVAGISVLSGCLASPRSTIEIELYDFRVHDLHNLSMTLNYTNTGSKAVTITKSFFGTAAYDHPEEGTIRVHGVPRNEATHDPWPLQEGTLLAPGQTMPVRMTISFSADRQAQPVLSNFTYGPFVSLDYVMDGNLSRLHESLGCFDSSGRAIGGCNIYSFHPNVG